ncbi:MAG: C_GCAxxG_C_C family protein [Desulfomonile tiedjei]|nr:C_GCAxxG_C_C family protein [Desulfomonile tiedjei]
MGMIQRVQQGFHCSEILLFAGLDAQGKTNPDLIRTVSGLAGGVGFSGELCGALTGGACLLGLYNGRGSENEEADPRLNIMVSELMDWFASKYGAQYGGIRCREITEDDPKKQPERCPRIVAGVLKKVQSLLAENGFEWKQASSLDETGPATSKLTRVAVDSHPQTACPCAAGAR